MSLTYVDLARQKCEAQSLVIPFHVGNSLIEGPRCMSWR